MKRLISLVLASVMLVTASMPFVHAQDDTTCTPTMDVPFVCRAFEAPISTGGTLFLQTVISDHSTADLAETYVLDMAETMEKDSLPQLRMRGLPAGTEYSYVNISLADDNKSMGIAAAWVSFQHFVVTLTTVGTEVPDTDDLVDIVTDIIDNAQSANGDMTEFLPSASDLPFPMSMSAEGGSDAETTSSSKPEPDSAVTRTPRKSSDSSTSSSSGAVTRTPRKPSTSSRSSSSTSSPSSRTSTSSGELQITDVTSRDAGIGDGTIYVYIELENNSSRSYDYVQVDIVCRNSNDQVVATGLANELGLPAGGSTVLTGIVMSASDCVRIQTKLNPLSN